MMMFAGLFDDDEEEMVNAIARRTRARTGTIEEAELAELELALPGVEPEFDWLDEGAEYDRFLTELNDPNVNVRELAQEGEDVLGTLDDDDDDDDSSGELRRRKSKSAECSTVFERNVARPRETRARRTAISRAQIRSSPGARTVDSEDAQSQTTPSEDGGGAPAWRRRAARFKEAAKSVHARANHAAQQTNAPAHPVAVSDV